MMNQGTVVWAIFGLFTLGLGLFLPKLNQFTNTPSPEEKFIVPKFKRTAELNGRISRAILILLGLGMLINGIGALLLPPALVTIIAYTLLALAVLGILLMIIITTGNWRV